MSRPAARAIAKLSGSMAWNSSETALQPNANAVPIVSADIWRALSQRGQAGASRPTRSSVSGRNDETKPLTIVGPRPAASTSTTARSWTPLRSTLIVARCGMIASASASDGTPTSSSRRAVISSTRPARPWTRSSVSSWINTGTPSPETRTSNSTPSQPGTARAATRAPIVFSGAWRQSPRCASRSTISRSRASEGVHRDRPSSGASSLNVGGGEREREGRADPLARLDPDPTAVLLHDMASDGEPEARAAAGLCTETRSVDLVEPLEDTVPSCPWDADTLVFDRRHDLATGRCRPDRDLAAIRTELDRVVDEVHDDLPESSRVATPARQAGRRLEPQRDALPLPEEPKTLGRGGGQTAHVEIVGHLEHAAALDPTQVEKLVDHLDEVTRLDLDLGDPVAHLRGDGFAGALRLALERLG